MMKNEDSVIEAIPWIRAIYRCKNDEHTPKNGVFFFFEKTMKTYSKAVILAL